MLILLAAATLATTQVQVRTETRADTAGRRDRNVEVSVRVGGRDEGDTARRIPVTEEHLRTAYTSPLARDIVARARVTRMAQDSALTAYDAMTYQRVSAGIGLASGTRSRTAMRMENAAQVKWRRGAGAVVELRGARAAFPMIPPNERGNVQREVSQDVDISPIPYYPGYDPLLSFMGDGAAKAQVDERALIHPLAEGAEAYYVFSVGDSMTFRIGQGDPVTLREIAVQPRRPSWKTVVGSLWFDVRSGQLVRAAYRLSTAMDIWQVVEEEGDDGIDSVPAFVRPMISPMVASIEVITIEYGLHHGRFWLPRSRTAEGNARVGFLRVPFEMRQTFRYDAVNVDTPIPAIVMAARPPRIDSLPEAEQRRIRDSIRTHARAVRDSIRDGLRPRYSACRDSTHRSQASYRFGDARLPVLTRIPCDESVLATAPELPPSIFDPGEEVVSDAEREALIAHALSIVNQARFAPQPPRYDWGMRFMRYNRIEGLSAGGEVTSELGAGYRATFNGRLGIADLEPNAELGLERSNLTYTVRGAAYNRLVSAGDWGVPLSFGSSTAALLFGRDEGFYFRASGVEATGVYTRGTRAEWRVFVEHQRTAGVGTDFSLARMTRATSFGPNLTAARGLYLGFSSRLRHERGIDPRGFRTLTDLRVEAAGGDSVYGRGAIEVTALQGLPARMAAALTLSGGSTFGSVPAQRLWYLGGTQTVRGQRPSLGNAGNAYWLTRGEVGMDFGIARPSVFADAGWAGDRNTLHRQSRALSGVGIGISAADGLVRLDLARGLYPERRFRMDLSLDARF